MQPTTETATGSGLGGLPTYDVYAPLRELTINVPELFGIVYFFNAVWNIFSVTSFLVSAFFIFGTIYAMQRTAQLAAGESEALRAAERVFAVRSEQGALNTRWSDVTTHIESTNPNDWRLAIIEADILLEESLSELGLAGATIGEKLRSASPQHFRSLDDAWKAHRVRNEIAHAGADFVLTQKLAQETINQYRRVFTELGKV